MINQKILDITEALQKVGQLKGQKFVYAVARNNNLLKPLLEEYVKNRTTLLESFAKKDDKGNSIILDDKDQFDRPNKKYDVPDMKKYNLELENLLKEEVEVKLYRIPQKELPADITADQLSGIIELVDEEPIPAK